MRKILLSAFLIASGVAVAAPTDVTLGYMDKSVKPGGDFFLYGNGAWVHTAVIPAERSYAGINLELNKQNDERLKGIAEGLLKKANASGEERKLRDLYAGYMDVRAINAAGMRPAAADLARIAAAQTPADIARLMGDPALELDGPFGMGIFPDEKHPAQYAVHLGQSGLGMPDRDYYLKDDKALAAARAAYKVWLEKALTLAGLQNAKSRAAAIYDLEAKMAEASWAAADRRDQDKIYNPTTLAGLAKAAPDYPWTDYFTGAGISAGSPRGPRTLIVGEVTAFPRLAKIFAATPVSVWRDYLVTRYLHAFAAELPSAVDTADFAFFGTVLAGNTKQLDRAERGVQMLDRQMGEALGKLYVARYFPPEAKAKADLLVQNLLKAYAQDIKTLSWMTPETRAKALVKLTKITRKIGYPDRFRDYSALDIPRGDPLTAIKHVNAFEANRETVRIDLPVDRSEWGMSPPTNNAYYDPTMNEIVFPAGILQPPYFDAKADDAVNYGEIGATIGHEISHGFDDQGSKFDGDGVFRNWWTVADRKNFDARTAALAKQYAAYEPLPGLHLNGQLTLGENIADLAGLEIALKAYHLSLNGKLAPVLDGFTGDQRFFIAYAQSWREVWRDSRTRRIVLADPHSPPMFRVNGVVRNSDGWYAAFPEIKAGDKYYLAPDQRVRLW
ncbi:MAG TPA: M13 family metallopeptidase [Rhizomicrobium sp.]|nr:M13 family metallopeptidase [Rhizomicrobium sp.]